jgi:hypothetical protein
MEQQQQRRIYLYQKRLGVGLYDVDVPADAMCRMSGLAERQRWHRTDSKFRQYSSDGLVYETNGRDMQRVAFEMLTSIDLDDADACTVWTTWQVRKQPFHAFPCDLQSLRHVSDVHRSTFRVTKAVALHLELISNVNRVGEDTEGTSHCQAYIIATPDNSVDAVIAQTLRIVS